MTKKVALILLGTGWTLGFTIAAIPLFWNKWDTAQECEFDEVLHPWYVAGIITPVFSMVWICLLMVYWRIWKEASKHAKQMRTSGLHESASDWKSVQVSLEFFVRICFAFVFIVHYFQLYPWRVLKTNLSFRWNLFFFSSFRKKWLCKFHF
jgi:muscarinic acetylcholine receptor